MKAAKQNSSDPLSTYLRKNISSKSPLTQELKLDHLLDAYEHAAQRFHQIKPFKIVSFKFDVYFASF